MFRPWRRTRPADGAPSLVIAGNQAVRTAEAIVCLAWAQELLRRRDQLEFEVSAACEDCVAAHRRLAAAQRDGDPRRISLAHTALERALAAARASTLTRDQTLPELCAQVRRLTRITRERMASVPACRLEHDGPEISRAPLEAPDLQTTQAETEPATQHKRRVSRWWLGRFPARSAPRPQQS